MSEADLFRQFAKERPCTGPLPAIHKPPADYPIFGPIADISVNSI